MRSGAYAALGFPEMAMAHTTLSYAGKQRHHSHRAMAMNLASVRRILFILACALALAALWPQQARAAPQKSGSEEQSAKQPTLSTDTKVATAGFYTLSWRGGAGAPYELQESSSANFSRPTTIYRGADAARVMSGQEEGKYYYRVRTAGQAGAWSRPVAVDVDHHPLARALAFFTAGLLVFAAVVAVILIGAARTRNA
jgi:hypothetical protein